MTFMQIRRVIKSNETFPATQFALKGFHENFVYISTHIWRHLKICLFHKCGMHVHVVDLSVLPHVINASTIEYILFAEFFIVLILLIVLIPTMSIGVAISRSIRLTATCIAHEGRKWDIAVHNSSFNFPILFRLIDYFRKISLFKLRQTGENGIGASEVETWKY